MRSAGAAVLMAILVAPLFLAGLGRTGLSDPDEGRNAEVAREMLVRGDWITPRINDAVYLDKPPAYFWAVGASLALFGVDEAAARLPSALSALAGVALTCWFARRHFGARTATLAGVILALSPLYLVFGRLVIFDMMLLVCTTVAVMAAYEAIESERPRRGLAAIFFVACGLGTITKGPVALVVPLLVAIAWVLVTRRPRRLGRLHWGTGIVLYLLVVAPWALAVERLHPGFLDYALVGENLKRMSADPFDTARPFHFYLQVLVPGLFPWLILILAQGAAVVARRLKRGAVPDAATRDAATRAARFLALWLGVLIVFFSSITSKRPSYVLPCAVPVAILAARLIDRASMRRDDGSPAHGEAVIDRAAGAWAAGWLALLAGVGVLLIAHGPFAAILRISEVRRSEFQPFLPHIVLAGAGLLLAAALLVALRRAARPAWFLAAAAVPFLAFVPLARAGAREIESLRSSRGAALYLAGRLGPDDVVVINEEYRPGMNFYLGRPIWQVTRVGRVFTSNYIEANLEAMRKDPEFRLLSADGLRERLRDRSRTTWVLTPRKEYARLEQLAGVPLERVYQDDGVGLFTAAAASAADAAASVAPAGEAEGGTAAPAAGPF